MNPVTHNLLRNVKNRRLEAFVANWDALEELVIHVYKGKEATPQDNVEYQRLRQWICREYPRWRSLLHPYWRHTHVGGKRLLNDPFGLLLNFDTASDIVENWTAMQTLPAARESLNNFLMELAANRPAY